MGLLMMAAAVAASGVSPEPMLDGHCGDHRPAAQAIGVAAGIDLFVRQTFDHVWICFTAPPGSFATVDVELQTPNLKTPLNLHASAQLGEWDARDEAAAPKTPTDGRWWKIEGWTGTTNRFRPAGNGQRLEFFPAGARELQISKARFGRGDWLMKFRIAGLRDGETARGKLSWPKDGSAYRLSVK